jgi:hypothetical protein
LMYTYFLWYSRNIESEVEERKNWNKFSLIKLN